MKLKELVKKVAQGHVLGKWQSLDTKLGQYDSASITEEQQLIRWRKTGTYISNSLILL